jgi:hypothetical protein
MWKGPRVGLLSSYGPKFQKGEGTHDTYRGNSSHLILSSLPKHFNVYNFLLTLNYYFNYNSSKVWIEFIYHSIQSYNVKSD